MKNKVYVMDNRGQEKEATVVRYFKYGDTNFFVYTLFETDEDGYIKLYIKKIINGEDIEIEDENWDNVKMIIQEVFREIKANTHYSYEDLNISDISEIMENGAKIFRLRKDIVDEIINLTQSIDKEEIEEIKFSNEISAALANSLKDEIRNFKLEQSNKIVREEVVDDVKINDDQIVEDFDKIDLVNEQKIDEVIVEAKEKINIQNEIRPKEGKLKPIIIGSMPSVQYKEQINSMQDEIKVKDEKILNLEKEIRKYQELCFTLKKHNDNLNKELEKCNDKLNSLKNIIKDI